MKFIIYFYKMSQYIAFQFFKHVADKNIANISTLARMKLLIYIVAAPILNQWNK